jgi:hypothetical protein
LDPPENRRRRCVMLARHLAECQRVAGGDLGGDGLDGLSGGLVGFFGCRVFGCGCHGKLRVALDAIRRGGLADLVSADLIFFLLRRCRTVRRCGTGRGRWRAGAVARAYAMTRAAVGIWERGFSVKIDRAPHLGEQDKLRSMEYNEGKRNGDSDGYSWVHLGFYHVFCTILTR